MSTALTLLAASSASVSVGCNAVTADGTARHLEFRLDRTASTVELLRQPREDTTSADNPRFDHNGAVSFSAVVDGRPLEFKLWAGFVREWSMLDGFDLDSSSPSFGLPYISGVCDALDKVTPVAHKFERPDARQGEGSASIGCYGVTLTGDVFLLRFRNVGGRLHLNLEGDGYSDFVDRRLSTDKFPSLPENDQVFRSWTSYHAEDDGEPVSFVLEFTVNKQSLLQTSVADFQALGSADAPVMVARAQCPFSPTETR